MHLISYSKGTSNGEIALFRPGAASQTNPSMKLIDDSGSDYHAGIKLGYEFNYSDENWFSFTQGSKDPMNKLAARGSVNDLYTIYQIDRNQFIKAGYTDIDYDYANSDYHVGIAKM